MNSSTHTFEKVQSRDTYDQPWSTHGNIANIISTTTHNTNDIKMPTKGLLSTRETTAQPFKQHFHKFWKPQRTQTRWNEKARKSWKTGRQPQLPLCPKKLHHRTTFNFTAYGKSRGVGHQSHRTVKFLSQQDTIPRTRMRRTDNHPKVCSSISQDGQDFISTIHNTPNSKWKNK